jgi:hypothetical protein
LIAEPGSFFSSIFSLFLAALAFCSCSLIFCLSTAAAAFFSFSLSQSCQ